MKPSEQDIDARYALLSVAKSKFDAFHKTHGLDEVIESKNRSQPQLHGDARDIGNEYIGLLNTLAADIQDEISSVCRKYTGSEF
jgi:hypothetical protein